MSSISLPLSTKDKENKGNRGIFNAVVYKYKRKLWVYIRFSFIRGSIHGREYGRYEFIDSDKRNNKYAGCFCKKCFIERTCSFPYYYIGGEV